MYYLSDNAAQSHQMQLQKIHPFTQIYDIGKLQNTDQCNMELDKDNNNYNNRNKEKKNQGLFINTTEPKSNEKITFNSSIDKAKLYFVESGILGPNNFKDSSKLIQKTSTIHTDTCLRNQIRKASLCLRSRVVSERKQSYDDSLINLQGEINIIRATLDQGEIKIITLRTEIGKLKRLLQKIMHAQMEDRNNHPGKMIMNFKNPVPHLCLFCQPRYSSTFKGSSSIEF